jgi:CHAT domain-containing protein/Tfp pilus assembly protein PilF
VNQRTDRLNLCRRPAGRFTCFLVSLLFLSWPEAVALATGHSLQQDIRPLECCVDKGVERKMAPGELHLYRLTLPAGHYLHIEADQLGIDLTLTLFGPDDRKLSEVDRPNSTQGRESLLLITEASGNYWLEVRGISRDTSESGYVLWIEQLLATTEQNQDLITADRATAEGWQLHEIGTAEALRTAIEKFTLAVPHWRAVGERYKEAVTLNFLGEAHHNLSSYQQALAVFELALPLWRALGDHGSEGWTLNNLAAACNALGEKQQALDYYRQSLRAYQAVPDAVMVAVPLTGMSVIYASLGEKQQALDALKQALAAWQTIRDPREARTLHRLGELYASLGDNASAFDYLTRALQIWRRTSDLMGQGLALHHLGRLHAATGNHQQALETLSQALQLRRQAGDRRGQAYTLTYLGAVASATGDTQQALDNHGQALALWQEVGDRYGEAYTLTYLGAVYHSLGEWQRATDSYSRALPLRRMTGDREGEADTIYHLARLVRDQGSLNEARAHLEEALRLTQFIRTSVLSQDLRTAYFAVVRDYYEFYVDLLMQLHRRDSSAGYDAQALEASEQARARSLLELLIESRADIRQGVPPQLIERERRLQQRLNAKAEAELRLRSGKPNAEQIAAIAGELQAIIAEYQEVRAEIRAASPRYAALTQPRPLGAAEIQRQILDENTLLLEYSIGQERSWLWAVTPTLISSYELPGRAEIEVAARQVWQLLTARNRRLPQETTAQWRARIRQADRQYPQAAAALSRMLLAPVAAQLGNKRLMIVTQGALQFIPFGALPEPKNETGRQGDSGTGRKNRPITPSVHRSVAPAPLIARHEITYLPSASTLALLRRDAAGIESAPGTIAVLADPVFSADDERVRAANGRARQPSRESSAILSGQELTRDLVRAVADLSGTDGGTDAGLRLARLSGTRQEAEAILSLAPSQQTLRALDFDASRASATSPELSRYRILHFATHAFINTRHPELSGIVLSLFDREGRPEDGFLRAHEIFNLSLPAELVVLSACQTGLGKEVRGEGLVGLTQSFMYAGTPRVMVSLWSLNDRAAAELMTRFYQRLLGPERMSPAAALRAAQIEMAQTSRWQPPYFWAAFVLQGEWK